MNNAAPINPRRYWRSSSFTMALLFALLLGACVCVLGYFSSYFAYDNFVATSGKIIDTEIAYLSDSPGADLPALVDSHGHDADAIYLLMDADQKAIAGNIAQLPTGARLLQGGMIVFGRDGRTYAAKVHLFDNGQSLLVGRDITDQARGYAVMRTLSIVSIALMGLVILISFIISRFVVSRTNRIAMTAKRMMDTGDLSQRIALDQRWDDLSHMAFVLNAFLDRIEKLMLGIRQVSDNIAHDLKTPLTRLHNDFDTLKNHPALRDNAEVGAICDRMAGESHRLIETFNALLRIAGVEAGHQKRNFNRLDLVPILRDVVDLYEPLAQKKNIALSYEGVSTATLRGDANLLFQAFANIIDNAVKFTPPGGAVTARLFHDGPRFNIWIADNGPGIAAPDRPKVFDRFYRADSSRSSEGNGLGLSVVAAIIHLHDGTISLHDAAPGLRVVVAL